MQSENEYIGDDKFKKFLEHYECPTSLDIVKMKFAGALCSPNMALRPTDVISSFWEENHQPRLETKNEAELFFKFFMGLWDAIFNQIAQNKFEIPKLEKKHTESLHKWCQIRHEELEYGFLEGFWGGCKDLKIPSYVAKIIDSLSEIADIYLALGEKSLNGNDSQIRQTIEHTDKTVQKTINFIIENTVLPRINEIERTVN